MKFCKDCVHYKAGGSSDTDLCMRETTICPVRGEVDRPAFCKVERGRVVSGQMFNPYCGPDGAHFEQINKEVAT